MEFKKINIIQVLCVLIFAKILITGLSFSDGLGALVILAALQLNGLLLRLYPKQVDALKELSLIQETLIEVQSKQEALERDVTALRIGSVKR